MRKQITQSLFFLMILSALPAHYLGAKPRTNVDNITKSLQAEYQKQLSQKRAAQQRPRRNNNQDILRGYQRYVQRPRTPVRRAAPVRRPPVRRAAPVRRPPVRRAAPVRRPPVRRAAPVRRPPVRRPPVRRPYVARPAIKEKPPIPDAQELFDAASYGNIPRITQLLQQGININVANAQRETAVHMAAARGRYSTLIYLINNGANPFARTIKNWIPLHHATRFKHANIARYLMQKGLSPHYRNSEGYSSIDMARTNHDWPLLNVFGAR